MAPCCLIIIFFIVHNLVVDLSLQESNKETIRAGEGKAEI
jgi:hypothetical protein